MRSSAIVVIPFIAHREVPGSVILVEAYALHRLCGNISVAVDHKEVVESLVRFVEILEERASHVGCELRHICTHVLILHRFICTHPAKIGNKSGRNLHSIFLIFGETTLGSGIKIEFIAVDSCAQVADSGSFPLFIKFCLHSSASTQI